LANQQFELFVNAVDEFRNKQLKQKQRGLNDYNILTSVLNPTDEVRLHSRMIYSLLDPSGNHYQGTLFLEIFINTLSVEGFSIKSELCSVYIEYRNIDLYITDGHKHIIIENKLLATDQETQIQRYIEIIRKENEGITHNDILVVYLSIDRKKPTKYSLGYFDIEGEHIKKDNKIVTFYKSINYNKEIISWLKKCQFEVQNITNLNEAVKQYIDVVKIVNSTYKEKCMSLSDFIKNDKSNYKTALDIYKAMPNTRKDIVREFFTKLSSLFDKKYGNSWVIEIKSTVERKYNIQFLIYKKTWDKENCLLIGYEFDDNDFYNGYLGIYRGNEGIDIKNEIVTKFKDEIAKLSLALDTTHYYLHWEWLPEVENSTDFTEYVTFTPEADNLFLDRISYLISNFEEKTGLLSKINSELSKEKT